MESTKKGKYKGEIQRGKMGGILNRIKSNSRINVPSNKINNQKKFFKRLRK